MRSLTRELRRRAFARRARSVPATKASRHDTEGSANGGFALAQTHLGRGGAARVTRVSYSLSSDRGDLRRRADRCACARSCIRPGPRRTCVPAGSVEQPVDHAVFVVRVHSGCGGCEEPTWITPEACPSRVTDPPGSRESPGAPSCRRPRSTRCGVASSSTRGRMRSAHRRATRRDRRRSCSSSLCGACASPCRRGGSCRAPTPTALRRTS